MTFSDPLQSEEEVIRGLRGFCLAHRPELAEGLITPIMRNSKMVSGFDLKLNAASEGGRGPLA